MSHNRPSLAERLARGATVWTGSTKAFVLSVGTVLIWLIMGPIFGFSDTWQLVINTATTIITFLMVFLIQRSQNKDSIVIQSKLDEIIASLEGASNRMINIEDLSEEELKKIYDSYHKIAELAEKSDKEARISHSIEEEIDKQIHQGKGG